MAKQKKGDKSVTSPANVSRPPDIIIPIERASDITIEAWRSQTIAQELILTMLQSNPEPDAPVNHDKEDEVANVQYQNEKTDEGEVHIEKEEDANIKGSRVKIMKIEEHKPQDNAEDNNLDTETSEVEKSLIEKPDVEKPDVEKPVAVESAAEKPGVENPDGRKPGPEKEVVGTPEVELPQGENEQDGKPKLSPLPTLPSKKSQIRPKVFGKTSFPL
jgi:hypothetical protein